MREPKVANPVVSLFLRTAGRLRSGRTWAFDIDDEISDRRVRIPVRFGMGTEHRVMVDTHLLPVLRAGLSLRDGLFVDVGAHTGQSLVKLLMVDPSRGYLGFEPQPAAAAFVAEILDANRHPGHILAAAAGSESKATVLFSKGMLDDGASIVAGFRVDEQYDRTRAVPVLAGDEVLRSLEADSAVALIKIDAEGAELDVVEGFRETVGRDRPVLLCEVLPVGDRSGPVGALRAARTNELLGVLERSSYEIKMIDPAGRVASVGAELTGDRDFDSRDFVFVPAEHSVEFESLVNR